MGVGFQLLERAGRLIRHAVGILLLAWRRVLWAMLIGGLVGIALVEIVAAIVTHQVPPGIGTQVAALAFGVALAYAAGLTVLADELLRGAIETVRLLEGDVKAGARAAAIVAEREVGEIRLGLGRRRAAGHAAQPTAYGSRRGGAGDTSDAVETSAETLDAIAATDEFTSTAPRPRINARPVRADQLPRIPWAYEQRLEDAPSTETAESAQADESAETLASLAVPDAAPYVEPLPPLPLKSPPEPEAAGQAERTADEGPASAPASRAPFIVTLAPQPTTPDSTQIEAPSSEARVVPVVSQPRSASEAQPADSATSASQSEAPRGVWSRISQALVGNTLVEPAEWTDSASGDGASAGGAPTASPDEPSAE